MEKDSFHNLGLFEQIINFIMIMIGIFILFKQYK